MNIAVAGTGYVGLVTGVCLAEKSDHTITCVDVDEKKVQTLNKGLSPIYEDGLEDLLKDNLRPTIKRHIPRQTLCLLLLVHLREAMVQPISTI